MNNTPDQYGERVARALDLWVKLARTFATMHRCSVEHVRTYRLTEPQFGVVECLGHKGPLTFTDLGRKQLASGGNMTVVVDNLEKEGIVERARCVEDRRQIYVRLTSKGRRLFDRVFPEHAEMIADCLTVLNSDEQERLASLLKKLGTGIAAGGRTRAEQQSRGKGERSRKA
jgi:MarR family 2-MHQ and catechol resistance regulon transcriptional repressor